MNGAGAAALSGFLRLAPLPSEACVLLAEGGSTMLAARANTPAPGAPGYVFESFFDTWIADDGRVLFESFVETPDAGMTGAWTFDDAAGISLLLREGGPAPGEPGATLAWPTAIHAGRSGDVVFQAAYAEGGVPDLEHVATLFAPAGAGAPRVLVRHGDPVRLRSGKLVPAFFQLPEFLVPRDLTPVDAGRVAMQAFLDDGRVAIVVIDAPVP